MITQDTIVKAIITEQSMEKVKKGIFTFRVPIVVDKNVIRKEVETRFKVNVLNVKTITVKGKKRKVGKTRQEVAQSSWKKAMVQLKQGQKIDLFEVSG